MKINVINDKKPCTFDELALMDWFKDANVKGDFYFVRIREVKGYPADFYVNSLRSDGCLVFFPLKHLVIPYSSVLNLEEKQCL